MVLELLEGLDLGALVKREGPLAVGRAVRILMQVCDALRTAHAKGIVHRDLKPQNIFVSPREEGEEHVTLLDFGIAKLRGPGQQDLTRTGQTIGTPYFMSPEQAHARRDIDQRSDLYSLGVNLFHCLTGALPFEGDSFPMLVVKICQDPPPSIALYRSDIPDRLAAIIERLLAKKPEERFSSAAEVKAALAEFAGLDTAPQLEPNRPEPGGWTSPSVFVSGARTRPAAPSRVPIVVAVSALVVALGVGGVLLTRELSRSEAPAARPAEHRTAAPIVPAPNAAPPVIVPSPAPNIADAAVHQARRVRPRPRVATPHATPPPSEPIQPPPARHEGDDGEIFRDPLRRQGS
jgi:serine/threonine-protein kinase